jgi:hypothetical protein
MRGDHHEPIGWRGSRGEAQVERAFRETINGLRRAWTTKARFSEHFDWITWTKRGAELGSGTLLARSTRDDRVRLRACLSVAFNKVCDALAYPEAELFAAKPVLVGCFPGCIYLSCTEPYPTAKQ